MKIEVYFGKKLDPWLVTSENAINLHVGEWITCSKNNKVRGGVIDKLIHILDQDSLYLIRIFVREDVTL